MALLLLLLFIISYCATAFEITLTLPLSKSDELEDSFWTISNPESERYGKFMSLSDLAAEHGASEKHIQGAFDYLIASGAHFTSISGLNDSVTGIFDETEHGLELSQAGHPTDMPEFVLFSVRRDYAVVSSTASAATVADNDLREYTVKNIKEAYNMPIDLTATNPATSVMTWGPGTFGYSKAELKRFKLTQAPLINMDKVVFDTENHGESGGDNFGEGQLDVDMLSAFALNATVLVSNTNTSASTEETKGFGAALLDFLTSLAARETVPHVLSMSLGSLSAASCDLLCDAAVDGGYSQQDCENYLVTQRQVCMFLSQDQTDRINTALQVLGTRGVTVLGASGDGGSHFSFGAFESDGGIGDILNQASCANQMPVFPTASPYILSIGGEMWRDGNSKHPITWAGYGGGSGGGFSIQFEAPEHQKDVVAEYLEKPGMPPSSGFNAKNRAYPDMAAVGVDGTSQSCPIAAGMLAMIVDQVRGKRLPTENFDII